MKVDPNETIRDFLEELQESIEQARNTVPYGDYDEGFWHGLERAKALMHFHISIQVLKEGNIK